MVGCNYDTRRFGLNVYSIGQQIISFSLRNEGKRIIKERKLFLVTIKRIQNVKISFIPYHLIDKMMYNII
jgi:hypothetical protein